MAYLTPIQSSDQQSSIWFFAQHSPEKTVLHFRRNLAGQLGSTISVFKYIGVDFYFILALDFVQLGFLPRSVAKWVAPLSDTGNFAFSAFIHPMEVLGTALEQSSKEVKLILYAYAVRPQPEMPFTIIISVTQGYFYFTKHIDQSSLPVISQCDFSFAGPFFFCYFRSYTT